MLRILYVDKIRYEEVLERVGTMTSLVKEVRDSVLWTLDEKKELQHLVTTGQIYRKRSRVR